MTRDTIGHPPGSAPHAPIATGERTAPGLPREDYWFARHVAGYAAVVDLAGTSLRGATVVDAGLGEGYGADALLRAGAARVTGLDYDAATTAHAAARYPGVHVVRANLAALPLATASVDIIVSLQVVEHLWALADFLRDCHRALRPGGHLFITTPNRPVFSPGLGRGERPVNPFHVEEFDADQVAELLRGAGFADPRVLGLAHAGDLAAWERRHGSIVAAQVAALESGRWPPALEEAIARVGADDFVLIPVGIDGGDGSDVHDLLGHGRRA